MNETDEFLDSARPSEDDAADAPAEDDGGDDNMVFMDEAVGSGGAPAAPAVERPKTPPPARPASQLSPKTPPPRGPSTESGRAPRPGSDPPGGRRASEPGRPTSTSASASGVHRPASTPPTRPPSGGPRPAPETGRSSSGRLRALKTSSPNAAAGPGTSSGRHLRPVLRPERTQADDDAALAAVEARLQQPPANDPYLGRDLGPFRVERFVELDRGERRYLAVHAETQRTTLLRVFPLVGPWADEFKRLADRGERACKIEGVSLDSALGAGRTKEAFFVGFDLPAGPTLTEVIDREGPLSEVDVMAVVEQVAKGLGALHAREMYHQHLSTDVIRRLRPGTYVLEAAGLARPKPALSFLAAGGDVLGTPGFVAPETVDGGEHSKGSDLYALGCVAWTLLCGRPPFKGDDEIQVLLDQLNQPVPKLASSLQGGTVVSESAQTIVEKLTGYTPDVRYRDAHELLQDLKARERGEKVAPPATFTRTEEVRPKAKLRGAAVSLIVLALLNAGLVALVAATIFKAMSIPLEDPLQGVELPLPTGK